MTERNLFARSPLSLSAVVMAAAMLLAILAGLAVVFGSVLRLFGPAPVAAAGASSPSLLLSAILVTLVVIAVLLAALLWRCWGRGVGRS
jgi:hypothetical protein